jgi:hypothetical protein
MNLRRIAVLTSLLWLAGAAIATAQNPFVGAWKLNQAKSHLAGDTMSFDPAEGQAIQLTAEGTHYSFRIDGKTYRTADGDLAAWKQPDSNTWITNYSRPDGRRLNTDAWKLSPDGKTLTVVTSGTKPDGENYTNTAVYERTAGESGLYGSWKSVKIKLGSPSEMIIGDYGLGGLSIKIPAEKASLLAAFDSKDVVPEGPDVPPGLTLAFARIGPSAFRRIEKIDGTVVYSARYVVSADGKTMTETGNAPGDPPQTAVWEKQ